MDPVRHHEYAANQRCSVPNCSSRAEYEVYLYDYYWVYAEEFFEQDYTCPFICEAHMSKNELEAVGDRVPRGHVHYLFTNRYGAQGYSKYSPLSSVFPQLFQAESSITNPAFASAINEVNVELLTYMARHPEALREIDPRKFEMIIAEIFRNQGFDVELTPATRDGGMDVRAVRHGSFGTSLYLVECKRYAESKKVGVEVVRGLYGVLHQQNATKGVIATTSSFSRDAITFASPLKYQLSLYGFADLKKWLEVYANPMER
jgi:hypothetical protein